MIAVRKGSSGRLREAGELLGVEAVDRTGLVVTSEGAFVRIFRVCPVNPLLMSGEERAKAAGTFQRLISQLHDDERIQVVVEGRPVNLGELVGECRRQVEACAGPPPRGDRGARDRLALSRWRLHAALEESLRLHADSQAAVEVNHYLVVPFLPRQHIARAALAYWRRGKLPTAPLERTLTAHRRAVREHLGRVDALRSELEAEGMATELLDGEQVVALLWSCFNPTRADGGARPSRPASCSASSTRRSSAKRRSRPACGCGTRSRARASTSSATRISPASTVTRSRRSSSRRPLAARAWGGCTGRC